MILSHSLFINKFDQRRDPAKKRTSSFHSSIKVGMAENQSVPGTIHLVDIEGTLRAKHASGGQNDVVLIPAPSDDPDDPLNWSAARKMVSTACVSMYVCLSTSSALLNVFWLAIRSLLASLPQPCIRF